jgi:hypothetical protein
MRHPSINLHVFNGREIVESGRGTENHWQLQFAVCQAVSKKLEAESEEKAAYAARWAYVFR